MKDEPETTSREEMRRAFVQVIVLLETVMGLALIQFLKVLPRDGARD